MNYEEQAYHFGLFQFHLIFSVVLQTVNHFIIYNIEVKHSTDPNLYLLFVAKVGPNVGIGFTKH